MVDWSSIGVRAPRDWAQRYKLTPIRRREYQCPRCGSMKVLVPFTASVELCARCAKRWALIDDLAKSGAAAITYNTMGTLKCIECGAREPVMVVVAPGKLCIDCIWYGIAGRTTRLRVEGIRW